MSIYRRNVPTACLFNNYRNHLFLLLSFNFVGQMTEDKTIIISWSKRSNFALFSLDRNKNSTSFHDWKSFSKSIFFSILFCTEQAVSSISKTWNYITVFVQAFIQGCSKDFYIWMSFLKGFYTFWSRYKADKFDI